jgi:hypothetical protein
MEKGGKSGRLGKKGDVMKNISNKVLIELVAIRDDSFFEYRNELLRRLDEADKYKMFFTSISCLYAEGPEFMTKTEIYEAIKKDVKRLE